jgi:ribosomal protein S14
VPPTWPPAPEVEAGIAAFVAAHGERALQTAISAGQHAHPQGLFYGGRNPTWSQQTLRHVLQEHGTRCARLGWIDLHTGLGPSGHGERIFAGRDEAAALARARAWWGAEVTSMYDGSSTSAQLTGLMCTAAYEECAQAEYTGIALEYGTVPLREVVDALRADQWLENHPEDRRDHAAGHQAPGARRLLHRHRGVEGADRRAGRGRGAAGGGMGLRRGTEGGEGRFHFVTPAGAGRLRTGERNRCHESGHRHAVARDGDFLALLGARKQLREAGPGFDDGDGDHGQTDFV